VPDGKYRQGYRYVADKFAHGGLTRQRAELVNVARVAECPIQLECRVSVARPFVGADIRATAFQVEVLRTHVDEDLLIVGTSHVDPLRWDPLIMKFTEFFGGGRNLRPSRLAAGWQMPAVPAPALSPVRD
jgi:flavin reductase (DIM6/NTAB) family NADH-FMN oxidoreductase RutF